MSHFKFVLFLWLFAVSFSACSPPTYPTVIPPFHTETKPPDLSSITPIPTLTNDASIFMAESTATPLPYPAPTFQGTMIYPYPGQGATVPIPYTPAPTMTPYGVSMGNLNIINPDNAHELIYLGEMEVYTDTSPVVSIDFSPDGNNIAFGNRDGNVYLINLSTGTVLNKLCVMMVDTLSFTPFGDYLIIAGGSNIYLWDLQTFQTRIILAHLGANNQILSIAVSPDGKLIASISNGGSFRIWDVQTGKLVNSWKEYGGQDTVTFSPDGKTVATTGGRIRFWDYKTGLAYKSIDCPCDITNNMAYNPNGDLLVTGGRDHIARIWEVKTGVLLSQLDLASGEIMDLSFSPDGEILAVGATLWRVETGELLYTAQTGNGLSIDFNPEGNIFASTYDNTISLFGVP